MSTKRTTQITVIENGKVIIEEFKGDSIWKHLKEMERNNKITAAENVAFCINDMKIEIDLKNC